MDELVRCFVDEAHENLVAFADTLILLERDPDASGLVDQMFRNVHTIKGAAGFLAFAGIERVSHAAESVLALVRCGELAPTPALASVLLAAVDALTAYVDDVSRGGVETTRDDSVLLGELDAATHWELLAAAGPEPIGPESDEPGTGVAATEAVAGPTSVRVGADTVDRLLELVGELVTVRNTVLRMAAERADLGLARCAQDLSNVTDGLHDGVRAARVQRVGNVWQGLPRLVRDTALQAGKLARLSTEGADIEFDRDVLDAVRDPLVHMVRNAVDHGIETPERRRELGKDPEGSVVLRAIHTAGHVLIELTDDGRGIDPRAVGARALQLGLVSAADLDAMAPADVVRLVLHAGLSTSDTVTRMSGRGVGMDVVRRNVEQVGGVLDIDSVAGAGTTISLRLPMSLGITQVLTMAVGSRRYAMPYVQVVDLLHIEPENIEGRVDVAHDGPVLRWRSAILPLVDLADLLRMRSEDADPTVVEGRPDAWSVAVVRSGGTVVAVRADRFCDTEEVVVRRLGRHLEGVAMYTGAAVLADGSVALILDSAGVGATAGRDQRAPVAVDALGAVDRGDSATDEDDGELLTVDVGGGRRLALPLALVVRVLQVETASIEPVGSWHVVRLDDTVLPVVRVRPPLAGPGPDAEPALSHVVVVRTESGEDVGIVVRAVEDIASAASATAFVEDGLVAVAVVRGRLAGHLDVRTAIAELLDTKVSA